MADDVQKAIIAGVASIVSAVAAIIIKDFLEKRRENNRFEDLDNDIITAVCGLWRGQVEQILNGTSQIIPLDLILELSRSGVLLGTATVAYNDYAFQLVLKGGFHLKSFLKFEYENKNKAIRQFGAFILELSDDSKKLEGQFVGYGYVSGAVIGGTATFKKV